MSAWELIIRVTDITEDEAEELFAKLESVVWDVHGLEALGEGCGLREVHSEDADA
jgi:hypothetical protein